MPMSLLFNLLYVPPHPESASYAWKFLHVQFPRLYDFLHMTRFKLCLGDTMHRLNCYVSRNPAPASTEQTNRE
jgi:hypothetical protein